MTKAQSNGGETVSLVICVLVGIIWLIFHFHAERNAANARAAQAEQQLYNQSQAQPVVTQPTYQYTSPTPVNCNSENYGNIISTTCN